MGVAMWKGWIIGMGLGAIVAATGCAREGAIAPDAHDAPRTITAAPSERVLWSPAREGAMKRLPPDARADARGFVQGWRRAVVSDEATWRAFVAAAGFSLGELKVDWSQEVVVVVANHGIGGALTFDGMSREGAHATLRYGPSVTFGPAWADAESLVLAMPIARAELADVAFVENGTTHETIRVTPLPE